MLAVLRRWVRRRVQRRARCNHRCTACWRGARPEVARRQPHHHRCRRGQLPRRPPQQQHHCQRRPGAAGRCLPHLQLSHPSLPSRRRCWHWQRHCHHRCRLLPYRVAVTAAVVVVVVGGGLRGSLQCRRTAPQCWRAVWHLRRQAGWVATLQQPRPPVCAPLHTPAGVAAAAAVVVAADGWCLTAACTQSPGHLDRRLTPWRLLPPPPAARRRQPPPLRYAVAALQLGLPPQQQLHTPPRQPR